MLPVLGLAAVLASGGAVRHAGAGLEHDDVDVGRVVLRGRRGSHLGGRRTIHASGDRLLRGARDPGSESCGRGLGDRRNDGDHHPLRSAAVSPTVGVGG